MKRAPGLARPGAKAGESRMAHLVRFFILFFLVDVLSRNPVAARWLGKVRGLEAAAGRYAWLAPLARLIWRLGRRVLRRRFAAGV